MEERIQKALDCHKAGGNCCQSVVCAYCDLVGLDEGTAFRLAEGFGFGMGGMEGTCGAVSGAILLCGWKLSGGSTETITKQETYKYAKRIVAAFIEKNGGLTCRELKGIDTGVPLRSCPGCIEDACRIAEQVLELREPNET